MVKGKRGSACVVVHFSTEIRGLVIGPTTSQVRFDIELDEVPLAAPELHRIRNTFDTGTPDHLIPTETMTINAQACGITSGVHTLRIDFQNVDRNIAASVERRTLEIWVTRERR